MNNYKITWMQNGITYTRLVTAFDIIQAIQNTGVLNIEIISANLIESAHVEDRTYTT